MRLRAEQLERHLAQSRLAPAYVVFGDEPLQQSECADAIRAAARHAGAEERIVLDAGSGFDWKRLGGESGNLSLFATRRLIDLRLTGSSLGAEGAQALQDYAASEYGEDILLVTAGKFDGRAQQSAWFNALDTLGVIVQVWPVSATQLPAWVQARAQSRQLRLAPAAVQLIADRAEGNLLAAAQEIEKLMLFQSADPLDDEALRAAVMDNARYDPFDAVDAAFGGDASRAVRILRGLAAAGTEPVPVIWAFDREVRTAAGCAEAVAQGQSVERVLERAQVWPKRRALVCGAIRRHPPRAWLGILRLCSRLDRVAKGAAPGDPWTELQWLSLALAGRGKAGLARVFLD